MLIFCLLSSYLVCRSLLSKRQVLTHRNNDTCFRYNGGDSKAKPPVDQVVVLVIDALRPDFAAAALKGPMARGARCAAFHEDYVRSTKNGDGSNDKVPRNPAQQGDAALEGSASLTYIQESLNNADGRLRSFGMFLVADSPTTTSQRLKAVTTGGLPAFVEAGSNFNADAIIEDSIIYQLQTPVTGASTPDGDSNSPTTESRVVVLGDDTWLQLYPAKYWRRFSIYPSFDVRDLDSNDELVLDKIYAELENSEDAKLVIGHFLGVDHAGHRYNADNAHMDRKLRQLNVVLRNVSQTLTELANRDGRRRMLMVFGDHGMTDSGDHGGASPQETDTFLFSEIFEPTQNSPDVDEVGAREVFESDRLRLMHEITDHRVHDCESLDALCGLARCSPLLGARYRIPSKRSAASSTDEATAALNRGAVLPGPTFQIDLVPTFAMLLGTPIPYSALGRIIPEVLLVAADPRRLPEPTLEAYLTRAMKCNERQMTDYFEAAGMAQGHQHHQRLHGSKKKSPETDRVGDAALYGDDMAMREYYESEAAVAQMSSFARMQRTHIDKFALHSGAIALLAFAVALTAKFFAETTMTSNPLTLGALLAAVTLALLEAFGPSDIDWDAIKYFIVGLCAAAAAISFVSSILTDRPSVTLVNCLALLLLVARVGGVFSNSFITKEDDVNNFVLQTLLLLIVAADGFAPRTTLLWAGAAGISWVCYTIGVRERTHGTHIVAAASPLDLAILDESSVFHLVATSSIAKFIGPLLGNELVMMSTLFVNSAKPRVFEGAAAALLFTLIEGVPYMHLAPLVAVGYGIVTGRSRVAYGLLLSWFVSLTQHSISARLNGSLMLVAVAFSAALLKSSTTSAQLRAFVVLSLGWALYFAISQQCEASTLDWNAAFVGMREYNMVLGGSLVMARTFFPFVALQVVGAISFDDDGVAPRLVYLAMAQLALSSMTVAVHCHHLMLWAIFNPKFLADLGLVLAGGIGYGIVQVVGVGA